MSLARLKKHVGTRVMGIDASTQTIAYAIFDGESLVEYGEIFFEGGSVFERLLDAKRKIRAIKKRFRVDFVAIESAVMVRSVSTGLKMAYMFGAIMGELLDRGIDVIEVRPIEWQSFIGNNNFTKAEREKVKKDNPGKSDTWIKAEIRNMRKNRTMQFVKKLGVETDSDNVSDAAAIAWYAVNNLKR